MHGHTSLNSYCASWHIYIHSMDRKHQARLHTPNTRVYMRVPRRCHLYLSQTPSDGLHCFALSSSATGRRTCRTLSTRTACREQASCRELLRAAPVCWSCCHSADYSHDAMTIVCAEVPVNLLTCVDNTTSMF
jgi:hypothetical protein